MTYFRYGMGGFPGRPKPARLHGKFGKISVDAAAALIRAERKSQISAQRAALAAQARKQPKIKVYDTTARKVEEK